jgi:tRNA A37 threonylcarbamoyladenosine biosynthesis protein TsaE
VDRNKKLVHADFYRLESIDEILHTGIEDYLYSENNYVFVEWGSKIKDYLKTGYVEIEFKYILKDEDPDLSDVRNNDQLRSILLKSESSRWLRKLEVFKKLLAKNRCI